jgi:hypothetical protein
VFGSDNAYSVKSSGDEGSSFILATLLAAAMTPAAHGVGNGCLVYA